MRDLPLNSKIVFLFLFLASACGVKGDPVSPKNATLPSVIENYPDINLAQPLQDNKQK